MLNLPPAAPHGPRQPASGGGGGGRSRTPSPDRNGNFAPSHTSPTAANVNPNRLAEYFPEMVGQPPTTAAVPTMPFNIDDYPPPSHPPPQFARGTPPTNPAAPAAAVGRVGVDGPRGRAESPARLNVGSGVPPPGLGSVPNATSTGGGSGMRIDMDAAKRYSIESEDLMTPIRPSEKAMGKRRAVTEAQPDEEELGAYDFLLLFFVFPEQKKKTVLKTVLADQCFVFFFNLFCFHREEGGSRTGRSVSAFDGAAGRPDGESGPDGALCVRRGCGTGEGARPARAGGAGAEATADGEVDEERWWWWWCAAASSWCGQWW